MLEELQIIFRLTYGHLPNGELYFMLRTNKEFRAKFWKCDERLTKWYLRDNGRLWKNNEKPHETPHGLPHGI